MILPLLYTDGLFSLPVTVGTPPQSAHMLLDFATADTFVFSHTTHSNLMTLVDKFYNPQQSETAVMRKQQLEIGQSLGLHMKS